MKIFDSHCHPQFPQYDADRDAMLLRAKVAEVAMICVGTDLEMSKKAIELAENHENIWASVGLHPNDNLNEGYDQSVYLELARNNKVVAIGEVGLDYFRTPDREMQKKQKERFEKQIDLAYRSSKPLIVHSRDAFDDMYGMLKHYRDSIKGAVLHSFTGTYNDAKKYVEHGFYIGLNGIITFPPLKKNPQAHEELLKATKEVPLESILIETDAPYLAPGQFRGGRNEPVYVIEVAKMLAQIRAVDSEDLLEVVNSNSRRFFGL